MVFKTENKNVYIYIHAFYFELNITHFMPDLCQYWPKHVAFAGEINKMCCGCSMQLSIFKQRCHIRVWLQDHIHKQHVNKPFLSSKKLTFLDTSPPSPLDFLVENESFYLHQGFCGKIHFSEIMIDICQKTILIKTYMYQVNDKFYYTASSKSVRFHLVHSILLISLN